MVFESNITDSIEIMDNQIKEILDLLGSLGSVKGSTGIHEESKDMIKEDKFILIDKLELRKTLLSFPEWNVNDKNQCNHLEKLLKTPFIVKIHKIRTHKKWYEHLPNPLFIKCAEKFKDLKNELEACIICNDEAIDFEDMIEKILINFKEPISNLLEEFANLNQSQRNQNDRMLKLNQLNEIEVERSKKDNYLIINFTCPSNNDEDCELIDDELRLCQRQYIWYLVFKDILSKFKSVIEQNRQTPYPNTGVQNRNKNICGIKILYKSKRDI